ncbi:MAG: GxxExxY protein [Chryseolinea sp.]
MLNEHITARIIATAMKIHSALGPGLLESAYRECMSSQLIKSGFAVEKEKHLPVVFDGLKLEHAYRMDLLVEQKVVVELKTVTVLTPVDFQQVLTYLRLGNFNTGLLINFQVTSLRYGIRRISNGPPKDSKSDSAQG